MAGTGKPTGHNEILPYRIELRGLGRVRQRVLARAFTVPLARAIFKAAQSENPHRRIALSSGSRLIDGSAN